MQIKKRSISLSNTKKDKSNANQLLKLADANSVLSFSVQDDLSIISKNSESNQLVNNFIILGIIGSAELVDSFELKQIVDHLRLDPKIKVKIFAQETITNQPPSKWPKIHALLCVLKNKTLLSKTQKFIDQNDVFLLNDLGQQRILRSRMSLFSLLAKYELPLVDHLHTKMRTSPDSGPTPIEEFDNYIKVGKYVLKKPFLEKPFDSDDHNLRIYYPSKTGGGCKILEKKNGVFRSKYKPNLNIIRRVGDFIYEKFLPNDGFDIHVNTIGVDYFHAEASKSPTMDCDQLKTVQPRLSFPVNLTMKEKMLCKKIVLILGQLSCQIEIIRSRGQSYICDVNGFSILKDNQKYLRDFVFILRKHLYDRFFPFCFPNQPQESQNLGNMPDLESFPPLTKRVSLSTGLSSQILLIKNKLKSTKSSKRKQHGSVSRRNPKNREQTESKRPMSQGRTRESKNELDQAEFDYHELNEMGSFKWTRKENRTEELRSVIAIFLHQDRSPKQKMKMITSDPRFMSFFKKSRRKREVKIKSPSKLKKIIQISKLILEELEPSPENSETRKNLQQIIRVLESGKRINGINRKIQLKPLEIHIDPETNKPGVTRALLVLKWGGNVTHAGLKQAERFGKFFRKNFYRNDDEGLLRLHATYRHDLKIYSADEGRCQLTAAALTKGLLMIEDCLTPILSSFVNYDRSTNKMLDVTKKQNNRKQSSFCSPEAKQISIEEVKRTKSLNQDSKRPFVFSSNDDVFKNQFQELLRILKEFLGCIRGGNSVENELGLEKKMKIKTKFCDSENREFFLGRWSKLIKDFYCEKTNVFDPSKLANILDFVRYEPRLTSATTPNTTFTCSKTASKPSRNYTTSQFRCAKSTFP